MEVSDQLDVLAILPFGEIAPGTNWIGGLVNPREGVNAVEERKILPWQKLNLDHSACSCRYAHRAIPTPMSWFTSYLMILH